MLLLTNFGQNLDIPSCDLRMSAGHGVMPLLGFPRCGLKYGFRFSMILARLVARP
ncbi:hypothetical protein BDZ89DRAFT_1080855 [Hymenopellis radicata]|nr:hypothetical protein BDZ89DRAFT_1080855 [Hymenopellis radicata]